MLGSDRHAVIYEGASAIMMQVGDVVWRRQARAVNRKEG